MAEEETSKTDSRRIADDAAAPRTTIVGIGASAGGITALQTFFEALPARVGAAFVVIVHLDPDARSELAAILGARAKMPVHQVMRNMELKPDCIYVIAPDRQLKIFDDQIAAVAFDQPRGKRTAIDLFFRSLAEQNGDGFAVILTGAGSDGALGVKAVKESGGIILVQDPEEAEYPSMPRAAIATEAADFILPVQDLAARLVELVQTRHQTPGRRAAANEDESLSRILAHLRARTGHDFSSYKRSTVVRRILRRSQVTRQDTFEDYYSFLREKPEEAQALLNDLLISVTTFFRDPKAFDALAKKVIPRVFEGKDASAGIRVWIAGCATGEEAYSLAILLLEEAARRDIRPEVQVFATDMDSKALAIAREGRYPTAIEADLSEDRLRRFFQHEGEHYRVKRELRDMVLFADHSLLRDPPFSRLDLVSCRNLLIYLNRELQLNLLATLHYALNSNGYLFLGTSETADHHDHLFRAIDREARLYQSTGRSEHRIPHLARPLRMSGADRVPPEHRPSANPRTARNFHIEALETMAPASIIVDESYRILHLSESAGTYLKLSGGTFTADVTELVRDELRLDLRHALRRSFARNEATLTSPLLVRFDGTARRVCVQVKPTKDSGRALILFIEGEPEQAAADKMPETSGSRDAVSRLQRELDLANSRLRTMREETEAANEELRAANEELQSTNEEYRSTAEELETSKEELQSINEELQTLNSELKVKFDAVTRANSDLHNLMAAMDFGTLFLDLSLNIKLFTPRLADLFNITANDIGRPITNFTHHLEYGNLADDARKLLRDLVPVQREVASRAGGWYLVRLRPYRTVDDKIEGVVITFLEVTERRRMEEALRASEERLQQEARLVDLSRAPIFVWDYDSGTILQWNLGSEELYGHSRNEAIGKRKDLLLKTNVPNSSFEQLKQDLLETGGWRGELVQRTKTGRQLTAETRMELTAAGGKRYVFESTRDVSLSKIWEARQALLLRELTHRVKNILTVIQSMVHQTWRTAGGKQDFMDRLDGRIAALSRSHDLLVDSDWTGTDLRKLVETQVSAYVGDSSRLRIQGPDVALPSQFATPFGLVLHELATNAIKYGALSNDKGRVEITWSVDSRNKESRLIFAWCEQGGPAVKRPSAKGFGTQLVKSGLPGAKVGYEFRPKGVECTIELPLVEIGGSAHEQGA